MVVDSFVDFGTICIVCLVKTFVLLYFLPSLLSSFLILSSLLIYFLIRLLPDLSTSSIIGPLRFQDGGRRRRPKLALFSFGSFYVVVVVYFVMDAC